MPQGNTNTAVEQQPTSVSPKQPARPKYVPIAQQVPQWMLTRPVAPHMRLSPRELGA